MLNGRDGIDGAQLLNRTSGVTVATKIELAVAVGARMRGLLGRRELARGSAMFFAPSNSIHTCFMRFPIDVLFVSRDGRVVKTYETLTPWRIAAAFGAYAAIELPAGVVVSTETRRGDMLELISQPVS